MPNKKGYGKKGTGKDKPKPRGKQTGKGSGRRATPKGKKK